MPNFINFSAIGGLGHEDNNHPYATTQVERSQRVITPQKGTDRYAPGSKLKEEPPKEMIGIATDQPTITISPVKETHSSASLFTSNTFLLASTLLAVLILGAFVWITFLPSLSLETLTGSFVVRFLSLFIEAAPFLLLGSLASGLIDTFVKPDHIARILPSNRLLGILMGTFAGFIFPVCECGVVPVVRQLYAKKLPAPVAISFLLAAPVMNPIVLFSTWTAFGFGPVLIGRYLITAVIGVTCGLIFAWRGQQLELREERVSGTEQALSVARVRQGNARLQQGTTIATISMSIGPSVKKQAGITSVMSTIQHTLQVSIGEFFDMGRFLVIGSLLAAGLQTIASQSFLASLGQGPLASVVTMQALAFVLSICSTVDAFLALAFTSTFTTGSILAFLTFGPMVDIKTTAMFMGVFGRKTVLWLTILPLFLTGIAGIILNLLGLK